MTKRTAKTKTITKKRTKTLQTRLMTITKALAREWLESVPDFQRKIDPKQVRKIVRLFWPF